MSQVIGTAKRLSVTIDLESCNSCRSDELYQSIIDAEEAEWLQYVRENLPKWIRAANRKAYRDKQRRRLRTGRKHK